MVLFDSGRGGPIPFEGVISEGPAVRVQFITDQPNSHNTGFNIRYEGRPHQTECISACIWALKPLIHKILNQDGKGKENCI